MCKTLSLQIFCLMLVFIMRSQTPNTISIPPLGNPQPQPTDTYTRAATSISLEPGFSFAPTGGFLNLNISSYPSYVNGNYQNPATTPGYYSSNPALEAAVTSGEQSIDAMGAFNYNIPIVCSPGTAGMEPRLSISYSSNGDNTWLGLGFNLTGISMITRVGRSLFFDGVKGGINFDSNDKFALDGSRLLQKSGTYGQINSTYKTEVENYYTITSYGQLGSGPSHFIVTTPDGMTMEYGNSPDSRRKDVGGTEALAWYINKAYDRYGNYMTYSYTSSNGELLIDHINYTGNGSMAPYNKVEFAYVDRSDEVSFYLNTKEFRRKHILKTITSRDANNAIVRSYSLDYQYEYQSLLTRITETDAAGNTLNPTFFDWTQKGGLQQGNFTPLQQDPIVNTVPLYETTVAADMDGDGISNLIMLDAISTNQSPFTMKIDSYLNPFFIPITIHNSTVRYLNSFVLDEEDDGAEEVYIIYLDPLTAIYYIKKLKWVNSNIIVTLEYSGSVLSSGANDWYRIAGLFSSTSVFQLSCFFYGKQDVTGDNIKDVIIGDQSQVVVTPGGGSSAITITSANIIRTALGDVNGDGNPEIFILRAGANATTPPYVLDIYSYDPSTSGFGSPLSMTINTGQNPNLSTWGSTSNLTVQNFGNATKSIDFGDFDNDGMTDIMYVAYSQSNAVINILKSNGQTFLTDPSPLTTSLMLGGFEAGFAAADINNDGYCDVMVTSHDNVNSTTYFDHYPNNGKFLAPLVGTPHSFNDAEMGLMGDFDGDNALDYVAQPDFHNSYVNYNCFDQNNKKFVTQIYNIKDKLKIQYYYLPRREALGLTFGFFYKTTTTPVNSNPAFKVTVPKIYVATATDYNGRYFRYGYQNAIYHETGKGLLGFERVVDADQNSDVTSSFDFMSRVTTNIFNANWDDITSTEVIETTLGQDILAFGANLTGITQIQSTTNFIQTGTNRYTDMISTTYTDFLKSTVRDESSVFDPNHGGNLYSTAVSNLNWQTQAAINSVSKNYTYQNLTNAQNGSTYYVLNQLSETLASGGNSSTFVSDFNYNTNGTLASSVKNSNLTSLAVTTNYTQYNNFGKALAMNITAPDLSGARSSSWQYDVTGRFITQSTNVLGLTEQAVYEPTYGNQIQSTDITGLVTNLSYDGLGRLIKTKTPTGAVNTVKYEWYNYNTSYYGIKVTETKEANGSITTYLSNSGLELKTESTGFGGNTIVTESTYLANNLLSTKSEPHFASQSIYKSVNYTYDWYSRPTHVTKVDNSGHVIKTINYSYNTASNSSYNKGFVQIDEPAGQGSGVRTTISKNNSAGQIDEVINYENASSPHSSSYTFNQFNQPSQLVTSFPGGQGGSTTTFAYDALGRRQTINDPSSGVVTTVYNSIGELMSFTKNTNQYTYMYDVAGRMVSKTGAGSETYSYDYVTSGNGLTALKKVTGPDVVSEYTYDSYNRPSQKKETLGSGLNSKQFISNFTYDKYGRLVDYTYPNSFNITHEYDVNGYCNRIRNGSSSIWELQSMLTPELIQSYYNSAGTLTQYTYDNYLNLQQKALGSISTQGFIIQAGTSNMLQRTHITATANNNEGFEFDNFDRLTKTKQLVGSTWQTKQNFTYKDNGNLDHKDDCGDYIYGNAAKPYQLTQIQNPTSNVSFNTLNVTHTAFDKVSQISESTSNKEYDFVYDNDQQRIKMEYKLSGQTQYTRYYQENYDREETSSGYREWCYINSPFGAAAVYYNNNGTSQQILDITTDNLGSPIMLTNHNGGIEEQYSFDAWGRRRNPADWTYNSIPAAQKMIRGYTGHEHLDELDLINMNGRIYYPVLGRFIEPDPLVQDPSDIQNMNRYSYVLNNPLKYIDPSGYQKIKYGDDAPRDASGESMHEAPGPVIYDGDGVRIEPGTAGYSSYFKAVINGGGGGGLGIASAWFIGVSDGHGPGTSGISITRAALLDAGQLFQVETGVIQVSAAEFIKTYGDIPGLTTGLRDGFASSQVYLMEKDYLVYNQGAMDKGNSMLDMIQTGLDVVGLIPGIGEVFDGMNAAIYAARGDYINAGLSAAAMVPLAGMAATGGKLTKKILKYQDRVEDATDLYHNFPRAFDDHIIENGAWSQRIKDGADWFEMPGTVNGKSGMYQIGINRAGEVFHRNFMEIK